MRLYHHDLCRLLRLPHLSTRGFTRSNSTGGVRTGGLIVSKQHEDAPKTNLRKPLHILLNRISLPEIHTLITAVTPPRPVRKWRVPPRRSHLTWNGKPASTSSGTKKRAKYNKLPLQLSMPPQAPSEVDHLSGGPPPPPTSPSPQGKEGSKLTWRLQV